MLSVKQGGINSIVNNISSVVNNINSIVSNILILSSLFIRVVVAVSGPYVGVKKINRSIWPIIIKSRCLQGVPWLFLANHPYHPSFPADLLDYILCPQIAVVGKFLLVDQH